MTEQKSTLSEIMKTVHTSDLDEQMKKLCDQIMDEERPKFNDPQWEPRGPNTFLSIQCNKPDDLEVSYLTLEREMKEKYIIVLMSKPLRKQTCLKRKRVWEVNESKPEKILKFYAETLKYVKGN